MVRPGMVHLAFLRSRHAHARIRRIDVTRARHVPGVVRVWTGADIRSAGLKRSRSRDGRPLLWIEPRTAIPDREERMEISARNQLEGKVKHVTPGAVMSEVVVDVGGQEVVSMISRASVERLGRKPGDSVVAIVKATEVMIEK